MSKTLRRTKTGKKLPESTGAVKRMSKKGYFGTRTSHSLKGNYIYTVKALKEEDEHALRFAQYLTDLNQEISREVIGTKTVGRSKTYSIYGVKVPKKVIEAFSKSNIFHKYWIVKEDAIFVYLNDKLFSCEKTYVANKVIEEVNHNPLDRRCKCSRCVAGKTAKHRRAAQKSNQSIKDAGLHDSVIKGSIDKWGKFADGYCAISFD